MTVTAPQIRQVQRRSVRRRIAVGGLLVLLIASVGTGISAVAGRRDANRSIYSAPRPRTLPGCPKLLGARPSAGGLRLQVRLTSRTIQQGQSGSGLLVIRNVGTKPFVMDPGQPLVAVLVVRKAQTVVSPLDIATLGTGYLLRVAPGETGTVPVVFQATPCATGATAALPQGEYGVRVVLAPEGIGTQFPRFLSPEARIKVVG